MLVKINMHHFDKHKKDKTYNSTLQTQKGFFK